MGVLLGECLFHPVTFNQIINQLLSYHLANQNHLEGSVTHHLLSPIINTAMTKRHTIYIRR